MARKCPQMVIRYRPENLNAIECAGSVDEAGCCGLLL